MIVFFHNIYFQFFGFLFDWFLVFLLDLFRFIEFMNVNYFFDVDGKFAS
jgi:hypothetical protein